MQPLIVNRMIPKLALSRSIGIPKLLRVVSVEQHLDYKRENITCRLCDFGTLYLAETMDYQSKFPKHIIRENF